MRTNHSACSLLPIMYNIHKRNERSGDILIDIRLVSKQQPDAQVCTHLMAHAITIVEYTLR